MITPHRSCCCQTVSRRANSNVLEQWAQSVRWDGIDLLKVDWKLYKTALVLKNAPGVMLKLFIYVYGKQ